MLFFVDMSKVWEVLGLGPGPTEYVGSRLPVEECRRKIFAEIDPPLTLFGYSRFVGFEKNNEIVLRRRRNPRSQAGFEVAVSVFPAVGGAELKCQLRPSAFIVQAFRFWFGLLALFTGYVILSTALKIIDHADIAELVAGLTIGVVGLGMAFLGSRILRFMRWRASADLSVILALIRDATSG